MSRIVKKASCALLSAAILISLGYSASAQTLNKVAADSVIRDDTDRFAICDASCNVYISDPRSNIMRVGDPYYPREWRLTIWRGTFYPNETLMRNYTWRDCKRKACSFLIAHPFNIDAYANLPPGTNSSGYYNFICDTVSLTGSALMDGNSAIVTAGDC